MAAPWGLEEKPISCPAAGLTGNTLPLTNTAVCQRAREGRYSTSPIPSWPTPEMAGKADSFGSKSRVGGFKAIGGHAAFWVSFFFPSDVSCPTDFFFFFNSSYFSSTLSWCEVRRDRSEKVSAGHDRWFSMTDRAQAFEPRWTWLSSMFLVSIRVTSSNICVSCSYSYSCSAFYGE